MILPALFFYLFAGVGVASAVMVIVSRNPVHSVLYLILAFVNASGLFILMGAEFLAMMLVVVYVGAVAVLFLFVVMMLDINFVALRQGFVRYLPIGAIIGVILIAELIFIFGGWVAPAPSAGGVLAAPTPALEQASNTQALGQLLYTQYFYLFQAAGMILLVAMIGAIVLTHRERVGVKRQRIATQLERTRDSVEIKNVPTGSGI